MYMRVLRCICNACRHQGTNNITDYAVRKRLSMPSVECRIQQRRLLYVARLLKTGPASLCALLHSRPRGQNEPLPWVALLINDFRALMKFHSFKLEHMPDPLANPRAWEQLICKFPREWS
eukprot:12132330-Karenia_brevis.AAC.1